jgi:hypothetical protein
VSDAADAIDRQSQFVLHDRYTFFSSFSLLRRDILSFNKQTNSTEDSTRFSLWIRTLNGGVVGGGVL